MSLHEELVRQKRWDVFYLGLAEYVSRMSKDPSTKVGAVVVDQRNQIVSLGYNGFPRGVLDTDERLNNREVKYAMIVHAEVNALAFAERNVTGSTLYTYPFMPCSQCAGQVIQHGVRYVVAPECDVPRWQKSFDLTRAMFNEAGVLLRLY